MIIKNLTRKSGQGQLLRYIFRYIFDHDKQLQSDSFIIRHNIRSKTIDGYIQEFKVNHANRITKRSDQAQIHHTVLSWSNKDTKYITDTMLKLMARKYIQLRGNNLLYVGTKHMDKNHVHIHLAMSASRLNGRSCRISKSEFEKLKIELDRYQKEHFPQLSHSLPVHGKAKMKSKELLELKKLRSQSKEKEIERDERIPFSAVTAFPAIVELSPG